MKPFLSLENNKERVQWAFYHIDHETRIFKDMYDYVHVDEKWFYMCEVTGTFYLANGEPEPERQAKSKRYIPKVMFLTAVARPGTIPTVNALSMAKLGSGCSLAKLLLFETRETDPLKL